MEDVLYKRTIEVIESSIGIWNNYDSVLLIKHPLKINLKMTTFQIIIISACVGFLVSYVLQPITNRKIASILYKNSKRKQVEYVNRTSAEKFATAVISTGALIFILSMLS